MWLLLNWILVILFFVFVVVVCLFVVVEEGGFVYCWVFGMMVGYVVEIGGVGWLVDY